MIQEIITGLIVASALIVVIYRIWQNQKKPSKGCNGCSDDCGGCAVMEIKKEIEAKKSKANS